MRELDRLYDILYFELKTLKYPLGGGLGFRYSELKNSRGISPFTIIRFW